MYTSKWALIHLKILQESRVFTISLWDMGSSQVQVIPKAQKMGLDGALPNTQHYKVRI